MPSDRQRSAEPRKSTSTLVIFFKAPSRSKRRLAQSVGDTTATAAAEQLLGCALEDARAWTGPVIYAPAEEADTAWLARTGARTPDIVMQHGHSLGERINHVDAVLRSRRTERLVYIGADCPTIDVDYLTRADAALDDADAVLGPAIDGGVVLLGARRAWPAIGDLPWSTAELRDDLEQRLTEHGWTLAVLDVLADVDDVADLATVRDQLANDARPARVALVDWLRARALPRAVTP